MSTMIATYALKSSVLGAGVGLVIGVVRGLLQLRRGGLGGGGSAATALSGVDGLDVIERFDSDLHHSIVQLGGYQKYAPKRFARICSNWKNFIGAYATAHSGTPGAGAPYVANRYVALTVEAIRELRTKVQHASPGRLGDFDDHAAKVQECLTNYNHNIILATQEHLNA